ncbi:hypothetical protein E2C01_064827 [Portunus trituberculatus]|uniref:Uncharacterized protein n=1 Tax=Portunus trituberculatus TaxID=210409 RepID=A0A5B7HLW2_PORTR|nr:hypothetical protein [Portunus trituberculatus]
MKASEKNEIQRETIKERIKGNEDKENRSNIATRPSPHPLECLENPAEASIHHLHQDYRRYQLLQHKTPRMALEIIPSMTTNTEKRPRKYPSKTMTRATTHATEKALKTIPIKAANHITTPVVERILETTRT